jgi:SAM-dependent methyltransferase
LLDLGSWNGETLRHFAELRPDLNFFSADKAGMPEAYPVGCQYHQADLERDPLPWPDGSMDAITCMHLIEHLNDLKPLVREIARLLKPGGRVYFETPHPKTLTLSGPKGGGVGLISMNFFDDCSHVRLVPVGLLAQLLRPQGLEVLKNGVSRNWLFTAAYLGYWILPASRKKCIAQVHWIGWSAYLTARRRLP